MPVYAYTAAEYCKVFNISIPMSKFSGCPQVTPTTFTWAHTDMDDEGTSVITKYVTTENLWTIQIAAYGSASYTSDGDYYPAHMTYMYYLLNSPTVGISGSNYVFNVIAQISFSVSCSDWYSTANIYNPISSLYWNDYYSNTSVHMVYRNNRSGDSISTYYTKQTPAETAIANRKSYESSWLGSVYPSGDHNFTSNTATCTSGGTTTCSTCGYSTSSPALGHSISYGGGNIYQNRTCTLPEIRYNYCTRCGTQSGIGTYQTQVAMGHDWGSGNGSITQNQTCTLPEIRYNQCTRCSATNGTSQTKSALGHNWQTATLSNNNGIKVQPDVYTDGTYYQTCSRCGTGHSGDYYTSHYNVVPNTKLNFQIYSGGNRINKIYIGSTLIMNSSAGVNTLVK